MHVVFFNRSYYPDSAATGQLLAELCESLSADHGCTVTVVAGGTGIDPATQEGQVLGRQLLLRYEQHRNVRIVRGQGTQYSKRNLFGRGVNYLTYFSSACVAGQRVPTPDIVVAMTDPPIIGLAAYLCARRFNAPLVMVYQDVFPEVAQAINGIRSRAVNDALGSVNRFLATRADHVVALGETMRQRLITLKGADPARTVVISNWADCSLIAPGPKANSFAAQHGLTDKFVVMHSGNIGMSQGLELLIDAAQQLRAYPDIRVVIVGDGVNRDALVDRARSANLDNVLFLPFQPKERLQESLAAADVAIISLKRGLAGYIVPSKLFGILAAGRPYVAAVEADCEISQITRQYNCGLLAEPGDVEQLVARILQLYHAPELRRQLGEQGRQVALRFDRPLQVKAYHDLLSHVLRSRRQTPSAVAALSPSISPLQQEGSHNSAA